MRNFLTKIILGVIATLNCYADNWESHWTKAVEYCHKKNFDSADIEFSIAINELENSNDTNHPHIYVDRARLYILQNKFDKALVDINKALNSDLLTGSDRIRGIVTRMSACANLSMDDQVAMDYQEFKRLYPNFPKIEFTKDRLIIRNMPDCKCYKKVVRSFLLNSELCENEEDIQMMKSGVCIAKIKKCSCGCKKNKTEKDGENTCKRWCDKMSVAGSSWCAKAFKNYYCQTTCLLTVDMIKDGCHWCCESGEFYKKCVKPFEDIVSQMDVSNCDPYWD